MTGTQIAALLIGGMFAALALAVFAAKAMRRLAAAGEQLPALADPTRCPDCNRPHEAHDDPFTPHYCDREVGF